MGSTGSAGLGARFYWPEVGRFVSQDPVRDGVNWNEDDVGSTKRRRLRGEAAWAGGRSPKATVESVRW